MNPADFQCQGIEEIVWHYTESTLKETIADISFWILDRNNCVPLRQLVCFSHGWVFQPLNFLRFPLCLEVRKLKLNVCPALINIQDFRTWILWANGSPSSFHFVVFFTHILRFFFISPWSLSYYKLFIFKCYLSKSCKNSPSSTLYNI